jgi:urease accessory protein
VKLRNALALAAVLAAPLAHAHTGAHSHFDLFAGLSHPLSGADHLLAMLAVGIWGAMLGGAARLALPASFVLAMLLGGVAGHLGMPLPAIETGIALSVLALGLLVSLSVRMPTVLAMALTAGFAVFHGFAHGVEAPADGSFWLYGAGFAVATAALHAAGFTLNQHLTSTARRVLGAGVAATGGLLLSGML